MLPAAFSFSEKLKSCNLRFTHNEPDEDRKEHIRISFDGDHGNTITLIYIFDPDGTTVNIKVFSVCKVPSAKLMDMYVLMNELNYEYRWIKFFIDSDDEVTVSDDAVIEPATAGEELFELMQRFLNIIDEVYPRIMKVVWG